VFVFYFILTAYICIDLVIAIVLENIELSDNQKKQIQKVYMHDPSILIVSIIDVWEQLLFIFT
jgi:hypothetical protein